MALSDNRTAFFLFFYTELAILKISKLNHIMDRNKHLIRSKPSKQYSERKVAVTRMKYEPTSYQRWVLLLVTVIWFPASSLNWILADMHTVNNHKAWNILKYIKDELYTYKVPATWKVQTTRRNSNDVCVTTYFTYNVSITCQLINSN